MNIEKRPGRGVAVRCRRGFTLIELLAVVAIILLLVSLLMPAISSIRKNAQRTRAHGDVATIAQGLKQYYSEYQHWPTNLIVYDTGDNIEATVTGIEACSNLVAMLGGQDIAGNNPRRMQFMQVPPQAILDAPRTLKNQSPARTLDAAYIGSFIDPWGAPYKYMCDFNGDGSTHVEFTGNSWSTNLTDVTVAVWSQGPNGKDNAGSEADDVCSWQ